jgi:hypothetical protein
MLGMVGGVAGHGVASCGWSAAGQQSSSGITVGDCSELEGLQLLYDWLALRETLSHDELVPPLSWKLFTHPSVSLVVQYPGDWTAYGLWASSLTQSGAIAWQSAPSSNTTLSGVRFVSPDGRALYEKVIGVLQGVALDISGGISAAEQSFLGERQGIDQICFWHDTTGLTPEWTRAGSYGDYSVVTSGNVYASVGAFDTRSYLSYQAFVGPDDQFTRLMRQVYIPMLFQGMSAGSGSSESPTPTPEP